MKADLSDLVINVPCLCVGEPVSHCVPLGPTVRSVAHHISPSESGPERSSSPITPNFVQGIAILPTVGKLGEKMNARTEMQTKTKESQQLYTSESWARVSHNLV
jgi:hypothetical protein